MLEKVGAMMVMFGVAAADSDKVWVPVLIIVVGLLTAFVGGNINNARR